MENNRITNFLMSSLALLSVFCVVIFSVQAVWNSRMGADAITDIGQIYMAGVSQQVAAHFGTTLELRLSQVSELADAVPPDRAQDPSGMRVSLTSIARARGFEYLAFYTEEDTFETVYGPQLDPQLLDSYRNALRRGEERVGAGWDTDGTEVVMLAVPAAYPLQDGNRSVSLVAGLTTQHLSEVLAGNMDKTLADYSIIRRDGSMIIRGAGMAEMENYFDHVSANYKPLDGRSAEQFREDMQNAMSENRDFSGQVELPTGRWHVYCSPMRNSSWYLLMYMPYNTLDQTIADLGFRWMVVSLGGCVLVLGLLLVVFFQYFRMTRRQVTELDEARRSADQARQTAERASQVKSEFLSNMSHDIRTPMNGIVGMTNVAISNLDNTPQVRSCLKKINVSSRHLLGLLNDILDMSKIERGELGINMEPVSLRKSISALVPLVQPQFKEKRQDFRIYTGDIPFENVLSDTVRLTQLLLNLLGNASKFTQKGGEIQLSVYQEPSPKGENYIRTHMLVSDNGIGMEPEVQARIFEAFVREDNARVQKALGSGLGLTITKHIVDAMEGAIEVQSVPGEGSTFHVILDMEKINAQELEHGLPERHVLVVDSDSQMRESIIDMLSSIGLRADGAENAAQGLAQGRERRAAGDRYHLVLLDWEPEQAASLRTLRELGVPVLALYDKDWSDVEDEAQAAGIVGCIQKPVFRSGLYYGLRRYVQAEEIAGAGPEGEPDALPDFTGRRVLLAEDNELNYEIASELLQDLGIEVDWAENGQICVDKFMKSEINWYDVVLMDLRMPEMTGFEAAQAIRYLDREDAWKVPIIAVSADAFHDDIQRCLNCGMNAHTPKPFDINEVSRLMGKYIKW